MAVINRAVSYEDRVFDILSSIRNPWLNIDIFREGVPSVSIGFGAIGGVCVYRYRHSGLIGMDSFIERIKKAEKDIR